MGDQHNDGFSRRNVVGTAFGVASGMAVSMVSGAQAEFISQPAATPLQDPTTKYPGPPFKRQQQAWPGLASRMDPPPDHGEKSYRGSAS